MEEFTYFEILLLNELVLKEKKKIGKELDSDFHRCINKILRLRRMQMLLDLECKLNRLGAEAREIEEQEVKLNGR